MLALLALAAARCGPLLGDSDTAVADPEGTRTTTINFTVQPHPIILYQGLAADGPEPGCNGCPFPLRYVQVLTGVDRALNVHFTTVTSAYADISDRYLIHENTGGEVVALGRVAGLGAITSRPASGWGPLASAEPGNGYVLRFKPARALSADVPFVYARMYIIDWLRSTGGGIIGARVKYQLPF